MKCYYVDVPEMKMKRLERFVRENMPTQKQLLSWARKARLPEHDGSGTSLAGYVQAYQEIPSKDLTIRFGRIGGVTCCQQYVSADSRDIKEGLRRIVQRYLVRRLRKAGFKATPWVV